MNRRDPRERDPDYCAFIARLPCVICMTSGSYRRGVHVAHLRTSSPEHGKRAVGMAEKPHDRPWTLPLCPPHHVGDVRVTRNTQHHQNELAFYERAGLNPFELCLALDDAYEAGRPGAPVIAIFAARARRSRGG